MDFNAKKLTKYSVDAGQPESITTICKKFEGLEIKKPK